MTVFPQPAPPKIAPKIETRQQLEVLVENIASLRTEHNELLRALENEVTAIRLRYRASLAEIEKLLDLETSWAEAWARQHPEVFSPARTLACPHATIGFRAEPPRIERASRSWNWSRIAETLGELDWGRRYLRTPAPEVDKEAIVADLARLSPSDLRETGLKIIHGDRFYVALPTSAPAWQEAA